MTIDVIGILGASSLVGEQLLNILSQEKHPLIAFSRTPRIAKTGNVEWHQLNSPSDSAVTGEIPLWICCAPIWTLGEHYQLLEACGARRVVVLSSTSRFTKDESSNQQEQVISRKLADAEADLQAWAEPRRISWIILRPTLIYGFGRDKNIAEIVRFIRRFRFFPVIGKANGLRQPIHARDVATACAQSLKATDIVNRAYNISGAETLQYREMVARIFAAMQRSPALLPVPLVVVRLCITFLRLLPRYRAWNSAMAERMNQDLVFDHSSATRDFDFAPSPFRPGAADITTE